jgi:hypothetical protein
VCCCECMSRTKGLCLDRCVVSNPESCFVLADTSASGEREANRRLHRMLDNMSPRVHVLSCAACALSMLVLRLRSVVWPDIAICITRMHMPIVNISQQDYGAASSASSWILCACPYRVERPTRRCHQRCISSVPFCGKFQVVV